MEVIIIGALLIGLSLGLFGSGGSILTVPVLIYLLHHADKIAIAESLGIVGGIAIISAIPYWRRQQINWRMVVLFGVPGMVGTYAGAWAAGYVTGVVQLLLFGAVMLFAAFTMFRKTDEGDAPDATDSTDSTGATDSTGDANCEGAAPHVQRVPVIVTEGLGVGVLTGLVGVGGGFLIVPALVLLGRQSMRIAIGTSLVIIFLKSISGFVKYIGLLDAGHSLNVDWPTVGWFIGLGAVGSLAGSLVAARVRQQSLQRGFAVFLLVMAVCILGAQISSLATAGAGPAVAAH
ncbi:MAG: sulfite exporter TauE/SafE family protein [Planctomycetota bacterium]